MDGCDHDALADGRLLLRHGLIAAVIVCDNCHTILAAHGLDEYQPHPMHAVYLTRPQLRYLERLLADRVAPCPMADSTRSAIHLELVRTTPDDQLIHPLRSADKL